MKLPRNKIKCAAYVTFQGKECQVENLLFFVPKKYKNVCPSCSNLESLAFELFTPLYTQAEIYDRTVGNMD